MGSPSRGFRGSAVETAVWIARLALDANAQMRTGAVNSLRAPSRSAGESISRHHRPRTLTVSTALVWAIWCNPRDTTAASLRVAHRVLEPLGDRERARPVVARDRLAPTSTGRAASSPPGSHLRVSHRAPVSLSRRRFRRRATNPRRVTPCESRDITVGGGAPLLLISGLNVLESLDSALACADGVAAVASATACRPCSRRRTTSEPLEPQTRSAASGSTTACLSSSASSRFGPARDHRRARARPGEAGRRSGGSAQIPAFLSRQTDLVKACANGLPIKHQEGPVHGARRRVLAVEKARDSARAA